MFGKNLFIGKIFYRFTITIIISHHYNLEGPISNFAPGPEISGPALPFIRSCCIVRADAYLMMLLPCVPMCTLTSVHFCISTFATKRCVWMNYGCVSFQYSLKFLSLLFRGVFIIPPKKWFTPNIFPFHLAWCIGVNICADHNATFLIYKTNSFSRSLLRADRSWWPHSLLPWSPALACYDSSNCNWDYTLMWISPKFDL